MNTIGCPTLDRLIILFMLPTCFVQELNAFSLNAYPIRKTATRKRNHRKTARPHFGTPMPKPTPLQQSESSSASSWIPLLPLDKYPSARQTESRWYDQGTDNADLPFDCTGCGKCCKTSGDVYLSPSEVRSAATLLDMTVPRFKETYVAEEEVTVGMSMDPKLATPGDTGWAILKHEESDGSCVFLDGDTNMCGIYGARPVQCSTYPFWPRIMRSRESWNEEVRCVEDREGGVLEGASGRVWSVEDGGCEGMRNIGPDSDIVPENNENGVSVFDAQANLHMFQRYKSRFPTTEFRTVVTESGVE